MRNFIRYFYFSVLIVVFGSCVKEYEVPQDIVVHDFVWKGLNAYYLHQNEIADLADRRFNSDEQLNAYLTSFADYNTLFESLLLPNDEKSILIENYNLISEPELRTELTNGLEFGIIEDPTNAENVIGYVTHILPNSDAASKNITRGEFFNEVDGTQLTKTNYQNILLNGANNFTLQMVSFDGSDVTSNSKTVSLQKNDYTYPAIFLEKTMVVNADNIGYIMYNNQFSDNYTNSLNETFLNLNNQNVTELILDLRYNVSGGTFAKNMAALASMITGQFPDEVLIKEVWNAKAQSWFLENQADSLLTKFPTTTNTNTPINGLQVTDVYIILNGENFAGSSAIELLINSLKPYINVHVIGRETSGNNTGAITLCNSEDYDFPLKNATHTVALQPVVLSFHNKNDQTYASGFSPNAVLCANEDVLNLGVLGETSDPILNNVLNYISTGTATNNANCNPNNFSYLFQSIDAQRITDKGVFIKQNLPNTN